MNKLDRAIFEKGLGPEEIYCTLRGVVENVNALIGTYCEEDSPMGDIMVSKKCNHIDNMLKIAILTFLNMACLSFSPFNMYFPTYILAHQSLFHLFVLLNPKYIIYSYFISFFFSLYNWVCFFFVFFLQSLHNVYFFLDGSIKRQCCLWLWSPWLGLQLAPVCTPLLCQIWHQGRQTDEETLGRELL